MSTVVDKKINELNKRKAPIVRIDESLDKYNHVIPFPEKHEKMNQILKKTGHPENYLKSK
jgi:hypothetical protein